jgi:hypothetical protein
VSRVIPTSRIFSSGSECGSGLPRETSRKVLQRREEGLEFGDGALQLRRRVSAAKSRQKCRGGSTGGAEAEEVAPRQAVVFAAEVIERDHGWSFVVRPGIIGISMAARRQPEAVQGLAEPHHDRQE